MRISFGKPKSTFSEEIGTVRDFQAMKKGKKIALLALAATISIAAYAVFNLAAVVVAPLMNAVSLFIAIPAFVFVVSCFVLVLLASMVLIVSTAILVPSLIELILDAPIRNKYS